MFVPHQLLPTTHHPLRSHPVPRQPLHVRRLAQLLESAFPDLANAFPGYSQQLAALLQRESLGAFLQPIVEVEDLALAWSQVPLEDAIDELAGEPSVGLLLDVESFGSGEALPEGSRILIAPLQGSIKRK